MNRFLTTAGSAAIAVAALTACTSSGLGSNTDTSAQQIPAPISTTENPPTIASTSTAPVAPQYTVAQQNAIKAANDYLGISGFSRAGLIEQLSSSEGDGFKLGDATFAVDQITVNWNDQAVRSAKDYLKISSFSRKSLIEQLSSKSGDQYTLAQATYAADHVGL